MLFIVFFYHVYIKSYKSSKLHNNFKDNLQYMPPCPTSLDRWTLKTELSIILKGEIAVQEPTFLLCKTHCARRGSTFPCYLQMASNVYKARIMVSSLCNVFILRLRINNLPIEINLTLLFFDSQSLYEDFNNQ